MVIPNAHGVTRSESLRVSCAGLVLHTPFALQKQLQLWRDKKCPNLIGPSRWVLYRLLGGELDVLQEVLGVVCMHTL